MKYSGERVSIRDLQKIYRKANKKYPKGFGKQIVGVVRELKGIGILNTHAYFNSMVLEVADFIVLGSPRFMKKLTLKRLANSNFRLMVSKGECYFYTSDGNRVDPCLEELLKYAFEETYFY